MIYTENIILLRDIINKENIQQTIKEEIMEKLKDIRYDTRKTIQQNERIRERESKHRAIETQEQKTNGHKNAIYILKELIKAD